VPAALAATQASRGSSGGAGPGPRPHFASWELTGPQLRLSKKRLLHQCCTSNSGRIINLAFARLSLGMCNATFFTELVSGHRLYWESHATNPTSIATPDQNHGFLGRLQAGGKSSGLSRQKLNICTRVNIFKFRH
jgi:hypothetical protein